MKNNDLRKKLINQFKNRNRKESPGGMVVAPEKNYTTNPPRLPDTLPAPFINLLII